MDTNLDQRNLAAVFRRLDNTIHRVNHYPVDKCWQNKPCYPLERYPSFKQPWPDDLHVTSSQSLSNQSVAVCCQLHIHLLIISFFAIVSKVYSLQLISLWTTSSRMTVTSLMHCVAKMTFRVFLGQRFSSTLLTWLKLRPDWNIKSKYTVHVSVQW